MLKKRNGVVATYGPETDIFLGTNNRLEPLLWRRCYYEDKATIVLTGKGFVGN